MCAPIEVVCVRFGCGLIDFGWVCPYAVVFAASSTSGLVRLGCGLIDVGKHLINRGLRNECIRASDSIIDVSCGIIVGCGILDD